MFRRSFTSRPSAHVVRLVLFTSSMVLGMYGVAPVAQDSRADIVMHAADAVTAGLWRFVDDGSAASGKRAGHPDSGAAKLTSPLATPANYLELTFDAAAGRAYRLWIRGRADRDYYGNDSVFVQFSGTVNASGTPIYRIGSTSATSVVIEACSGCGLRGWGWADNLYGGTGFGAPLYFESSGPQRVRIQTREDGISIDQIVLSSAAYFASAPGAPKDDTTILPKTTTPPAGELLAFARTEQSSGMPFGIRYLTTGDFTGDGRTDVVALGAEYGHEEDIELIAYAGNRSFTAPAATAIIGRLKNARAIASGDFNGDGLLDVVVLNVIVDTVAFFAGTGTGAFQTPLESVVGDSPTAFAPADFNNDGRLDLVITYNDAIAVRLGNGAGGFSGGTAVAGGSSPSAVAAADFDGDGRIDVATANNGLALSVFRGDGTGRLTNRVDLPTTDRPFGVVAADFNRDGRPDLAASGASFGVVSVFLNAAGTFPARVEYSSRAVARESTSSARLRVAEMNGDGQLDLVMNHRDLSTLAVVPGRADGSFAAPEEFHHSYRGLVDFVAADFDGDSHADLFSTQSASVNFVTLWGATVAANRPPIADAGPDQVVAYTDQGEIGVGATASSDPDGHALKFMWRDASGNPLEGEENGYIAYPPRREPTPTR